MNATSLYVSTCRLVIQANVDDQSSWNDLYRLLPYLRQSLTCVVCDSLLVEPYSPDTSCQHHVCKSCRGGKKRLKPSCSWCKNYEAYTENVQLRILLQCYKKLNEYIASTSIVRKLTSIASNGGTNGLLEIIQEGAGFKDDFSSTGGLTKSALKQLPCVLNPNLTANVQTQTQPSNILKEKKPTVANGLPGPVQPSQPVAIAPKIGAATLPVANADQSAKKIKVRHPKQKLKRKGCRCGNATSAPGKLTCCGQRCPCYVDAKTCVDCRCRGCRNPHTPGGKKLRPFVSEMGDSSSTSTFATDVVIQPYVLHGTSMYTNNPLSLEHVPATLLVDDEKSSESEILDVDA